MKRILAIMVLMVYMPFNFSASEIPDVACPYEFDFSNVEVGSGGQDYVTNVQVKVTPDAEPGPFNIDLYDWLGSYIESTYYDADANYAITMGADPEDIPGFTGLVDGTYTFIVNDTYKGTFNVNHELQGLLNIEMSRYNQCNHDAYGGYIDPNTVSEGFYDYPEDNHDDDNYYGYDYNNDNDSGVSMTDIESATQSETNSHSTTEEQSEVVKSEGPTNYHEAFNAIALLCIVLAALLVVIAVLIVVIFKMRKNSD